MLGSACRWGVNVALVTLAVSSFAQAQPYVSPEMGFNLAGDAVSCTSFLNYGTVRTCSNSHDFFGVTAGYVTHGLLGFEGEFTYTPDFFGKSLYIDSNDVLTLMGHIVLTSPHRNRPYMSGGIGLIRTEVPRFGVNSAAMGVGIGGGGVVMVSSHVGVRVDIRYITSMGALSSATYPPLRYMKPTVFRVSVGVFVSRPR
jgi:hypothetical protein